MKYIVVSGASGLVGRWLTADLEAAGYRVVRLVRSRDSAAEPDTELWSPARGELEPAVLEGADAVINLNGRSIGDARWTSEVRDELRSSRLLSTRTLASAIAKASSRPRLLISASASGYYGDRGDEVLTEQSSPGSGFLADLCRDWETAALEAAGGGTRVVLLRLGMVIGKGGALDRMLTPFKLGAGGPIGTGHQWWPWIAMEDVIGSVRFALDHPTVSGPLNLVSPQEVTSKEFARTLGKVLNRPSFLPLPAFAARLALGEMADALLLASTRMRPAALEELGYEFRVPDLAAAIRSALD
jgi:uncharacterized protein (TIGR01777 family)